MKSVYDRAVAYVAKMDGAIGGSNGHDDTFSAACALVKGFDLSDTDAFSILRDFYNPKCSPSWSEGELRHKVQSARAASGEVGKLLKSSGVSKPREAGVSEKPFIKEKKLCDLYDHDKLLAAVSGVEEVDEEWFMRRSPIDPRGVMSGEFLDACFDEGERIIIFNNYLSQGDFAWVVGSGGYRLGRRGASAVRSALPRDGGADGVWFLSNPVDLKWSPKPGGGEALGRRSRNNVTSFRYLVLESDEAKSLRKRGEHKKARQAEIAWLKYLAIFPDPIRAIYSSGGDSWHCLLYVGAESWAHMDGLLKGSKSAVSEGGKMGAKRYWATMGADPAALTPVRLTRLPGCTRGGKLQKLIYLNGYQKCEFSGLPGGSRKRIVDLVPVR